MPSAKRARKRAAKQARLAELERRRRRRRNLQFSIGLVVVAALVALIVYAVSGPSHHKKTAAKTTTTASVAARQAAANKAAVAAGCPANPHTPLTKPTYSAPPPMTIDLAKTYTATVTTDVGTFTITLDPKAAPEAVNNFVFLARHGFYNCDIFHRVIPGFVDQTGDPTGTGTGGPGYEFTEHGPPPATNPADQYPLGSVAMANASPQGDTDPSTNGSQFFIVAGPEGESLPPDYVLLGKVTSGMSVVERINKDGSNAGTPVVIHRMLKVTISSS
ncbi:peptidylprolyl isomerase [Aciditerrimonas ferrireducens]|uniref:peptidylprolyl isomerase n=1 Tax=Aciditerrimonas ferrireducens TaxID=667306 RepID=UPI002003DC6E|nr:peptidylprolyl isomerase [Aciditerrimonas ferrireducens]MCK4176059.1 peptidylprolyl isomerase [Aciditerrimonas ferrireducens]